MSAGFTHEIKDNKLFLTIDLSSNLGPSKSGKSTGVATSHGNLDIGDGKGTKLGLNVYRPVGL